VHPSGGEVSIGGYDITRQFSKARKMIGFCPQENVLFTELTVEEHINFYALLKGIPGSIRKKLIEGTIREMDL
jgi:ATP-binding cassette, subfamily A (ABC1), member 3